MTPTTSAPSNTLSPSIGIITTIAGTGTGTFSGDNGAAAAAGLYRPYGVRVDAAGEYLYLISSVTYIYFPSYLGNVYIADTYNHRIRKVTVSTGIITTIAGSSTSGSYSGDNGPATSAALNTPTDLALDSAGIFSL